MSELLACRWRISDGMATLSTVLSITNTSRLRHRTPRMTHRRGSGAAGWAAEIGADMGCLPPTARYSNSVLVTRTLYERQYTVLVPDSDRSDFASSVWLRPPRARRGQP